MQGASMTALKSYFGTAVLGGWIVALSTLGTPLTRAEDAQPSQTASDEATARLIADEMTQHAGQQGAVRVAAAHFADKLESHHYPPAPMDGVADGAQVAKAINGSLATY